MPTREQMIADIMKAQEQKPNREQMIKEIMDAQKVSSDIEDASKMSRGEAFKIGVEQGGTFGLRPVVAGLSGAAGGIVGDLSNPIGNEGLSDRVKRAFGDIGSNYQEARRGAVSEQNKAYEDRPGYNMAGNLAGSAVLLPYTASAKGLSGAVSLGGKMGAAQALSEAESIPEAIQKTVTGAALGAGTYGLTKGLEKGIPYVADKIGQGIKKTTVRLGSTFTGETEKNIKNFIEKNDAINKIISESGGEISVAADEARDVFANQIRNYRQKLGEEIGKKLDQANPEKVVDVMPILGKLQEVKNRINLSLKPEAGQQIDDIVNKVIDAAGDSGQLSLRELHEVNQFLQDSAKASYLKGGQIFVPGKEAQMAAKQAAREGKIIFDKLAPDVKAINNNLSMLHKIEENINKNLIASGKPESALLAAGASDSGRNRVYLEKLGKIVGKDFIGTAEELAAAKAFANPNLLPIDTTGKSLTRMAVGGLAGSLAGGGINPVTGAMGAALTSPAALKQTVNAGLSGQRLLQYMYKPADFVFQKLGSPQAQALMTQGLGRGPLSRRMNEIDKKK